MRILLAVALVLWAGAANAQIGRENDCTRYMRDSTLDVTIGCPARRPVAQVSPNQTAKALQSAIPDIANPDPTTGDMIERVVKNNLFSALGHPDPCPPGSLHENDPGWCNIMIGQGASLSMTGAEHMITIGRCAGASVQNARRAILIGDYTSAPEGSNGFVNIANKLCFWRYTGERVDCPAPEPECVK